MIALFHRNRAKSLSLSSMVSTATHPIEIEGHEERRMFVLSFVMGNSV